MFQSVRSTTNQKKNGGLWSPSPENDGKMVAFYHATMVKHGEVSWDLDGFTVVDPHLEYETEVKSSLRSHRLTCWKSPRSRPGGCS